MLHAVGRGIARALVGALGLPKAGSVRPTASDAAAYEAAADRIAAAGGTLVARTDLPSPLMPFLCWLSENRPMLFHGSPRDDIEELAPVRLSRDTSAFGDQQAVYAASDPIWASWFAVVSRDGALRGMRNGSIGLAPEGRVFPRWYFFSVDRVDGSPPAFRPGMLYVLPSDGFTPEKREYGIVDTGQLVHMGAVRPLARIPIAVEDVPFVDRTVTHTQNDGQLRTMLRYGRANRRGGDKRGGGLLATIALLLAFVTAACGGGGAAKGGSETVRVFAASSLTEAFTDMAAAFQRSDAGAASKVEVLFQFGASSTLAQQIQSGAPVDVFVSADQATMDRAAPDATSTVIARNRLALIVELGNPKSIDGLDDLAAPGVVFVLCIPTAPCGHLGAALLAKAGVDAKPASLEENVKAVVSKVALGEADAGIVYQTDVLAAEAAGTVEGIAIGAAPDDPALQAVYPMAVLSRSNGAKAWAAYVTSAAGRRALAEHGFLPPDT